MKTTITINGVPPSLNKFAGRENSWEYRRLKADWTNIVRCLASQQRQGKPAFRAKVIITYYFPTSARHDPDNYAGKFILDGLTKAGIIVDDSFKHIKLELSGDVDRENPRTVVEVIKIE